MLFIISKRCACDSSLPSTHPSKATAVVEGQDTQHTAQELCWALVRCFHSWNKSQQLRSCVGHWYFLSLEQVTVLVVSAMAIQILLCAFVCYLAVDVHTTA